MWRPVPIRGSLLGVLRIAPNRKGNEFDRLWLGDGLSTCPVPSARAGKPSSRASGARRWHHRRQHRLVGGERKRMCVCVCVWCMGLGGEGGEEAFEIADLPSRFLFGELFRHHNICPAPTSAFDLFTNLTPLGDRTKQAYRSISQPTFFSDAAAQPFRP